MLANLTLLAALDPASRVVQLGSYEGGGGDSSIGTAPSVEHSRASASSSSADRCCRTIERASARTWAIVKPHSREHDHVRYRPAPILSTTSPVSRWTYSPHHGTSSRRSHGLVEYFDTYSAARFELGA